MAFCMNCGKELPEGAKFCAECGTPAGKVEEKKTSQRESVYEGTVFKCPNCGDIMDAHELICDTCGYERRGSKATSSVSELAAKLKELESKRPPKKVGNIFANAFTGGQISTIDQQIVSLIKNFAIPNTKEDILEFVVLAAANIDMKVYGLNGQQYQNFNPERREISDAWLAKFEQAYQKAQLMLGGSQEFFNIHNLYNEKKKEIKKMKRQVPTLVISIVGGIIVLYGFIFLMLALTGAF